MITLNVQRRWRDYCQRDLCCIIQRRYSSSWKRNGGENLEFIAKTPCTRAVRAKSRFEYKVFNVVLYAIHKGLGVNGVYRFANEPIKSVAESCKRVFPKNPPPCGERNFLSCYWSRHSVKVTQLTSPYTSYVVIRRIFYLF